ncbi:MAG: MotA/TolQ/ExbB proton channel family protein [Methanopyri archaeon]|nr:MotA/TolQ/ExbB proton channel family protein [Methanopyri archaeon]
MASVATTVTKFMYLIMEALFYPTIIILLFMFFYSIIELISFLVEMIYGRVRLTRKDVEKLAKQFPKIKEERIPMVYFLEFIDRLKEIVKKTKDPEEAGLLVEKELENLENYLAGKVSRSRIVVRLGPMFGLMGTLIPLGPGLEQLAKGNMAGLATALITAFATTVVGLVSAGMCYVVTLYRTRWYRKDVSDLEFLSELVIRRELGG